MATYFVKKLYLTTIVYFSLVLVSHSTYASTKSTEISLQQAIALTLDKNPELKVFEYKKLALGGARETASLRPALELGLDAENFAGSFNADNDQAEYTLSISSIIELGGKLESRVALVDAQSGYVESQRKAQALNMLGDLTRQFVKVINLQEKYRVVSEMLTLSDEIYAIASTRASAGAAPEAEALRAKAQHTKSRIELLVLQSQLKSELVQLAAFWSGDSHLQGVSGNLFVFKEARTFENLYLQLVSNPAVDVFASEERVEMARTQLLESQSRFNVSWQLGLRRFEGRDDTGVVAALSMPMGTARRNKGELASALAVRNEVLARKEQILLELRVQLQSAYVQRENAIAALRLYEDELLPALNEALNQTREAFASGRNSYMEWVSVQTELFNAHLDRIDLATQAQFATATIEQLSAQPLQVIEAGQPR